MSVITTPPAPPASGQPERPEGQERRGRPGPPTRVLRDPVIDGVRTVSMFVVVALHALLVGAWRTADGGLATQVALTDQPWFPVFTWCIQVMPLFFIAGGFAAAAQWRRMRDAGATATDYIRSRVRRLAVPAAVMITAVGAVLALARVLAPDQASAALIHEAAYRIGQPLWFLAVYAGVTALVPVMMRLHERFRWAVPTALLAAAIVVDVARADTGLQALGYLNLAFVWLFNQQLGFCLADARIGADRPVTRARATAGLVAALAGIAFLGAHGWTLDLLAGLNPPTAVLALLGVAQLCALQLAYPRLHALVVKPAVARFVKRAGTCAITVYLWHMPVVMALVAALWAAGAPLPDVYSPAWWATRGLWLEGIAACVIPVGLALAPVERWVPRVPATLARFLPPSPALSTMRPPRPWPATRVTVPVAVAGPVLAVTNTPAVSAPVLAIAGVATALLGGLSTLPGSVVAVLLLWGAVLVSTRAAARTTFRTRPTFAK